MRPFGGIYRLVLSLLFPSVPLLLPAHHVSSAYCGVFVWCIDSSQKELNLVCTCTFEVFLHKLYKRRDIVFRELTHFSNLWFKKNKIIKKSAMHVMSKTQYAEGQTQHFGTLNPDKNYYISESQIDISKLGFFFTDFQLVFDSTERKKLQWDR